MKTRATIAEAKPSSDRLIALDLLRGWFLIIILVDHLFYFPNGYDLISGRGQLFVSAAEGFFIISGLLIGIIRGGRVREIPFSVIWSKLWQRARLLYLWSVGLSFLYIVLGWLLYDMAGLKWGLVPPWQNISDVVMQVVTLQYFYGWADFLRLYAVYIFAAPLAIWLLRRGWWYVLVGLSVLVWTLPERPVVEADMLYTWQPLFFGALIVGYYWQPLSAYLRRISRRARVWISSSLAVITTGTIVLSILAAFVAPHMTGETWASLAALTQPIPENTLFHKGDMPLTRIALSFVWFASFFWLFHRYRTRLAATLGWILLPFGQHSLHVYIVQSLVIFVMHLWVQPELFAVQSSHSLVITCLYAGINFLLTSAAIALVWLSVTYRRFLPFIPR